jgi:hypothetical protein
MSMSVSASAGKRCARRWDALCCAEAEDAMRTRLCSVSVASASSMSRSWSIQDTSSGSSARYSCQQGWRTRHAALMVS